MDEDTRASIICKYYQNLIPLKEERPPTSFGNWRVYKEENGDIICVKSGTTDEIKITRKEVEANSGSCAIMGGRRRRRTHRRRGSKKHRKSHRRSRSHKRSRRHH
jgi:hypothetical protein